MVRKSKKKRPPKSKITAENAVKLVIKRLQRNVRVARRNYDQAVSKRNDAAGNGTLSHWNARVLEAEKGVKTAKGVLNDICHRAA